MWCKIENGNKICKETEEIGFEFFDVINEDYILIENDTLIIDPEYPTFLKGFNEALIQINRRNSYPNIGEQLDMLYWDRKNGTNNWEELIDTIKADNPNPSVPFFIVPL